LKLTTNIKIKKSAVLQLSEAVTG